MKTQLAIRHLLHHRARTAVAVAGIAFAVVLLFMQLGFLGAVSKTATMIYDALEFDLAIRSPAYLHISEARTFPRERIRQAEAIPSVQDVRPFFVTLSDWQSPKDGEWRGIMAFGTDPKNPVFLQPEIRAQANKLTDPQFLLIDRMSRKEFGPKNGKRFSDADIGIETDLLKKRIEIVGHFKMGTGLAANGAVVLSEEGFARISPGQTVQDVNMGLVQIASESNPKQVQDQLRSLFKNYPDVEVLTRDEVLDRERDRWVKDTSLGTIFQIGVLVSLFVGTAIVYQVLSTDIGNMLGEYATLKAMGYSDHYLRRIVVQQASILAIFGFVPGYFVSLGLYAITGGMANIPMLMSSPRILGVLVMTLVMCIVSSLLAVRKLKNAEPADLF